MIGRLINLYRQNGLEDKLRNIQGFLADEWLLSADGKVGLAVEKTSKLLAIAEANGVVHVINGRLIDSADVIAKEQKSVTRKPLVRSLLRYAGGRLIGSEITGAIFTFMTRQVNWSKVDSIFLELRTYDLTCPYTRLLIYRRGIMVSEAKAQYLAARWLQILNIIKR